jgi:hypothetical protein
VAEDQRQPARDGWEEVEDYEEVAATPSQPATQPQTPEPATDDGGRGADDRVRRHPAEVSYVVRHAPSGRNRQTPAAKPDVAGEPAPRADTDRDPWIRIGAQVRRRSMVVGMPSAAPDGRPQTRAEAADADAA